MATHYEILGVRPEAGHDEIKRAYTEHALRFHPDRQADAGAAARERAEFRMREVNRSWEVLRNPSSRAAYDRELREASAATSRPSAGARRSFDAASLPDLDSTPSGVVVPAAHAVWWRYAPIVVVALVLGTILVFTAYANRSDHSSTDPGVQVETSPRFEAGGCVLFMSAEGRITPIPADCSSVGVSRITQTVDLGRPCPSGQKSFDIQEDKLRLCYVG